MKTYFCTQLEKILDSYDGYDPSQGFFQRLSAQLSGHGPIGYARKIRLINQVINESKTDQEAIDRCIAFYLSESKSPSAKGSALMQKIQTLLCAALKITESEIEKHSPIKIETHYLGAADGFCVAPTYDKEIGFIKILIGKLGSSAFLDKSEIMLKAVV